MFAAGQLQPPANHIHRANGLCARSKTKVRSEPTSRNPYPIPLSVPAEPWARPKSEIPDLTKKERKKKEGKGTAERKPLPPPLDGFCNSSLLLRQTPSFPFTRQALASAVGLSPAPTVQDLDRPRLDRRAARC